MNTRQVLTTAAVIAAVIAAGIAALTVPAAASTEGCSSSSSDYCQETTTTEVEETTTTEVPPSTTTSTPYLEPTCTDITARDRFMFPTLDCDSGPVGELGPSTTLERELVPAQVTAPAATPARIAFTG